MDKNKTLDKVNQIRKQWVRYGQKKLFKLRETVNKMYFIEGHTKDSITERKRVSKHFVVKWTQSPEQDFKMDNRGWHTGRRRKWDQKTVERIAHLHQAIMSNPCAFYWGATAIAQEWRLKYTEDPVPPLRTIGQMLTDLGLSKKNRRNRYEGAARYLCYPEHTIYETLGRRVLEADFIGQKYLRGRTEPVHFAAFSFKKEPKLRYFQRVSAATSDNFISKSRGFFERFEKPDCMKVDNAAATIGSVSGKRNISKVMKFLLDKKIYPIYSVPRKPFSQASVEGNNSVFARKFWKQRTFKNVEEVDKQLEWFNEASLRYTGYQPPSSKVQHNETFIPKVYFIRQVHETHDQNGEGFIDILNETISLSPAYINYFVLAEWALKEESLLVYLEKEQKLNLITKHPFKINQKSKKLM